MKRPLIAVAAAAVAATLAGIAIGRELGVREARDQIVALLGARSADRVRIKSVSPGPIGDEAVVEAQIDLAFRMKESESGWRVQDVRFSDGAWESIELLKAAIDREKAHVVADDLRTLAAGVETFKADRGFYPNVDTSRALVDHLAPRYMSEIIREDPWHMPYLYRLTAGGFAVGSSGPDGKPDTADDVVVTGGAREP